MNPSTILTRLHFEPVQYESEWFWSDDISPWYIHVRQKQKRSKQWTEAHQVVQLQRKQSRSDLPERSWPAFFSNSKGILLTDYLKEVNNCERVLLKLCWPLPNHPSTKQHTWMGILPPTKGWESYLLGLGFDRLLGLLPSSKIEKKIRENASHPMNSLKVP